jgi:hypothetical protein
MLSSRAAPTIDQATVACLRIDLYMTLDRSDRAVDVGLTYLRHLGVEWSAQPREHSSGSRRRLGAISKRGDTYLRMLLIHGAEA